jgi:hypothetical protein
VAFIPKEARWYLADIILEHTIEGDPRNVVHTNIHLVEAESPEQAYDKALALGQASVMEYTNTDGRNFRVVFRGLRQLNVIHDELEDGAELTYKESVGVPEDELRGWVTPKEQLHVFAPIEPKTGCPNYFPESYMRMLEDKGFRREDVLGEEVP